MEDTRPAPEQGSAPVAPEAAPPSTDQQEAESGFFDRLIRTGRAALGLERPSTETAEDTGETAETTETATPPEPAWTPPQTKDELDKLVQSETDRREAKRRTQQSQDEQTRHTAAEWERIKDLARSGDVWALGEIAKTGVDLRMSEEERDAAHGAFLASHVPLFDQTFLDPLLAKLPEDVWKPIVGDGLTTLADRTDAVTKALDAHRERAVADVLEDPAFVGKLLKSQSFRAAWLKSDVVRKQFLATLRGDPDYEEADLAPGVARAGVSGDENADMDALLRGMSTALKTTRRDRLRAASNRDLIES